VTEPVPPAPDLAAAPSEQQPTHSPDGVDLTLIRWMLSLTPRERLLVAQQYARSIQEAHRAARPAF
jgi:hypothetical protein